MTDTAPLTIASDRDQVLLEHARWLGLSERELRRRWERQPITSRVTFGAGLPEQTTLHGDERALYFGVCILNPTAKTIMFGLGQGNAQGTGLQVGPFSGIVWPGQFSSLSLAVSSTDAAGPDEEIVVQRLWVPPDRPQAFPYGASRLNQSQYILGKMKQALGETLLPSVGTVELLGFSTVLTTSAKAGTRYVVLEWGEWELGAIAQEPGLTKLYNFAVGLDEGESIYYNFTTKTGSPMVTRPIPPGLTMSPGQEIGLFFHNLDAEGLDKWADQLIAYRQPARNA
jgi:hypothetical protein